MSSASSLKLLCKPGLPMGTVSTRLSGSSDVADDDVEKAATEYDELSRSSGALDGDVDALEAVRLESVFARCVVCTSRSSTASLLIPSSVFVCPG